VNLRQLLRALIARRRVFLVALSAVVLAAAGASLLMARSYRATVSVLVDAKDEQSLGDALRPLVLPQEHVSYLQTQVDILTSPRIARQVVEELHLAQTPSALSALGVKRGRDGRVEDRLVEVLRHNFKTETSQSNVIQASFTCADPAWAAAIANAFAQAYLDTMLELRVAPTRKAAAWFDEQLKTLRANLEDAQAKLAQAKLDALAKLSRHPERLPQVANNTFIQQLTADVLHGEAKLQELATQYGVNHPVYRRQVSEIQSLRARLQAEMRKLAASAAGAEASASFDGAAIPEQQGAAGARGGQLVDPVLVQTVETAERAYQTAMQRYTVSQVDSRASQTNVAVLNPAVAPLAPYRPNIMLNVALAALTGVVLGGILVVLLEMRDPLVRSAEDLLSLGEVPLLAVLGDAGAPLLLGGPPAAGLPALPKPQ
jgi:polysaccharide biosynthesis transport protein